MTHSVSDITSHILFHAEAEARESDPSQVGDVRARITFVRSVFEDYKLDTRNLEKYGFLREVSRDAADDPLRTSFRRVIANADARGDGSPRLAIQEWIARGSEDADVING